MNVPRYPDYQPSGIQWLRELPDHWEPIPLKYVTRFVNGMAFKPDEWSYEGFPIIRIENLNGGEEFNFFIGEIPQRYHVEQGDLLFGWSGNRGTSFGPFDWPRAGLYFLNQHIFKLIDYECDKRWFYWTLRALTKTIEDEAHGIIGMVHITKGELGALKIPRISLSEQQQIAAFLDWKTGQIDTLIARKKELLEKLKEKRIAVITQAVTQGLNPAAPMRDSGVPWLGQVPQHWKVIPLGFLITMSGGMTPSMANSEYWEGDIPWVTPKDMKQARISDSIDHVTDTALTETSLSLIPVNAVLIVVRGMILAHSFPTAVTEGPVTINQDMKALRCGDQFEVEYLFWCLTGFAKVFSALAQESAHGTRKMETETLKNFHFPVPSLTEQTAITAALEVRLRRLDQLAESTEDTINRLTEYRTAIITAATTGKIDLRYVNIPLHVA